MVRRLAQIQDFALYLFLANPIPPACLVFSAYIPLQILARKYAKVAAELEDLASNLLRQDICPFRPARSRESVATSSPVPGIETTLDRLGCIGGNFQPASVDHSAPSKTWTGSAKFLLETKASRPRNSVNNLANMPLSIDLYSSSSMKPPARLHARGSRLL